MFMRRIVATVVATPLLTGGALVALSPAAEAVVPYRTISSSGPLTSIDVGNELGCQVHHQLDGAIGELYPPTTTPADCGTFFTTGGTLYAPNFGAHGTTATTGYLTSTAFTPVSQSAVTGLGTAVSPYTVTTTVNAGATGLQLKEVDTYVVGDTSYKTAVTVTNTTTSAKTGYVYHGMDCYLGNNDSGYGLTQAGTGTTVGCATNPNNNPADRAERLVPQTAGNSYYEARFDSVWSAINAKTALPNSCGCATSQDTEPRSGGLSRWPRAPR